MKNIYDILTEYGLTVPEDKKPEFDKAVAENYKTVADYDKQTGKVTTLTDQLKTATDGLKAFEGVDVNDLKGQITTLTGNLATKDAEYQTKLADMEFSGLLDAAITTAKGRNPKALRGLLDVDTLKASKNQSDDIKAALDKLKESDGYLFDDATTPPPYAGGTGTAPIKKTTSQMTYSELDAYMKANPGAQI